MMLNDDARRVYDEVCGCECSMFYVVCDVRALFDDGSVVVLPAKDKGLPLFCPEVSGMVRPCREKLAAFWPSLCLRDLGICVKTSRSRTKTLRSFARLLL